MDFLQKLSLSFPADWYAHGAKLSQTQPSENNVLTYYLGIEGPEVLCGLRKWPYQGHLF